MKTKFLIESENGYSRLFRHGKGTVEPDDLRELGLAPNDKVVGSVTKLECVNVCYDFPQEMYRVEMLNDDGDSWSYNTHVGLKAAKKTALSLAQFLGVAALLEGKEIV